MDSSYYVALILLLDLLGESMMKILICFTAVAAFIEFTAVPVLSSLRRCLIYFFIDMIVSLFVLVVVVACARVYSI